MSECVHTRMTGGVVTVTHPGYDCGFCEMDRLREANKRLQEVVATYHDSASREAILVERDTARKECDAARKECEEVRAHNEKGAIWFLHINQERQQFREERDAAREQIDFLRDRYTLFGGRGCPACLYEDGKYIRSCQLHQYLSEVSGNVETLQTERDALIEERDRAVATVAELIAYFQSFTELLKKAGDMSEVHTGEVVAILTSVTIPDDEIKKINARVEKLRQRMEADHAKIAAEMTTLLESVRE